MSMGITTETPTPHSIAWSQEARKRDTIRFIEFMAGLGLMHLIRPRHVALTYGGMSEPQIEAEMVKHMQEGGDK